MLNVLFSEEDSTPVTGPTVSPSELLVGGSVDCDCLRMGTVLDVVREDLKLFETLVGVMAPGLVSDGLGGKLKCVGPQFGVTGLC